MLNPNDGGLIHPDLTRALREFSATEFAQAAWSRTLAPDFSRARLLAELAEIRGRLPSTSVNERMFGEPDFLRSVPESARAREWDLSRSALVAAVRGLDIHDLQASLSHSKGAALAVAVSGRGNHGIGVDLENSTREVSDAAFARFNRAEEGAFLSDRLDHWVLKEACFKSHPRSAETIVADYVVTGRGMSEEVFFLECRKGAVEKFRAELGRVENYRYAWAMRRSGSG